MIYKVLMDGQSIYGTSKDTSLLSPQLKIRLNSAGSLEFKMPRCHKDYAIPKILKSFVDVYENDELIWYGRVLETEVSMNQDKKIFCEGAYAYFNDSIQRPHVYNETGLHAFFSAVIAEHNSQVDDELRFEVGEIELDDVTVTRVTDYNTTKSVIEDMCLSVFGGYLFFRREDGVNYIDWLSDMPYYGAQPITFGLNLVDISQYLKAENLVTSIIPLGKEIAELGEKLTIREVNEGRDYIDSELVETYGRITKVVEFSEIGVAEELLEAGQNWLSENLIDPLTIKCNAAELHYLDNTYPPFRVGQKVKVESMPHLISRILPLTEIDISLDSATKTVSVGTPIKQNLTEMYI